MRLFKRNTNPMPLEDEAYDQNRGLAYVDPLIYWQHENWSNKIDRRMSMYLDPLIHALTLGWGDMALAKTFKFYDNHSPDGQEIMQEYREWWIGQDLNELLKACISHFTMDGHVLLDMFINEEGLFDYHVFGSYECWPVHWKRDNENRIREYYVKFIPKPTPYSSQSSALKMVSKVYKGDRLLHFTRGDWNYGEGRSRVMPCWDPAIKMRHGSHADFFRRDVRFMVAVPEGWKKKRIQSFMNSFNDMLKGNRRAFVYKMAQSKNADLTPLGLPSFGMESLAKTPAPTPYAQSESGGQLLRDPEWARYLAGCKLTENYFIGNQSGAVTGSEVDLTRDFYTECEEFGLLEPLIKGIIEWCAAIGLCPPPPTDYVIKYWKDWEHIEMGRALAEQEMQMQQQQDTSNRENSDIEFRYNSALSMELLYCIRTNASMPMTPVMSAWIKGVGFQDGTLYFETHDQTADTGKYAYDITPEEAESYYMEWVESDSKGGYWWDNIQGKLSPAHKVGRIPLPKMFGHKDYQSKAKQMREFKMKGDPASGTVGVGTSRAPFSVSASPQAHQTELNPMPAKSPDQTTAYSLPQNPPRTYDYTTPYSLHNSAPLMKSIPQIMEAAKRLNWKMSKSTAYNILDLFKYNVENNQFRINSWVVGNPMDFETLLKYADNPTGEKACKKEWQKISPHEGDLVVYDDLGHGGKAHKVGNYKYWWDEDEDRNMIAYNKEEVYENIKNVLKKLNIADSMIEMKINNNMPPSVSTEYYCKTIEHEGVKYQVNFHNSNYEPRFERIAIVNQGNCDYPACSFEEVQSV